MAIAWNVPTGANNTIPSPIGPCPTTPVQLDLAKLDAVWSKQAFSYVSVCGGANGNHARYKSIKVQVASGSPVDMPILYCANGNPANFQFVDGRHRTAVARDLGEAKASFVVPTAQAPQFRAAFA